MGYREFLPWEMTDNFKGLTKDSDWMKKYMNSSRTDELTLELYLI